MKKEQNGFSAVEIIMILVIVGLLAGVGWYVYKTRHSTQTTSTNAQSAANKSSAPTEIALTKSYTDPVFNYTFKYPTDWKVTNEKGDQGDGNSPISTNTITDASGKYAFTLRADYGGRGGACEPATGDKLFALNNACPSKQVLDEHVTANKLKTEAFPITAEGKKIVSYFTVDKVKYSLPQKTPVYYFELNSQQTADELAMAKTGEMGYFTNFSDVLIYKSTGNDFFYLASGTMQPGSTEAYLNENVPRTYSQILQSITLGTLYQVN